MGGIVYENRTPTGPFSATCPINCQFLMMVTSNQPAMQLYSASKN